MRTLCVLVLSLVLAAPAAAQTQVPAKPQTKSLDSEAPAGAPPHWLPNEQWVMQHWLPYDETRLYALLGIDRGDVWRWLRDDTRTLAGLARLHGWEPAALARELVAPWRGHLREPKRLAVLESRALRTLTQGHLSQHMFFHSLHQNAIPDAAPKIFGTSTSQFRSLRRSELSPLMICRLNGLSRTHAVSSAQETLRAMVARAVNGQAMPASQGQRLLQRQLRQLPRWLQQTRYNGPPPLKQPRGSIATASNYSNNAAFAGDGEHLVYEAYDAKLAAAKAQGEIGVMAIALGGAAPVVASAPDPGAIRRTPRSAYNPAVSADGRFVAFESAEGNLNFAKRYGQMRVYVKDLKTGVTTLAPGIDYRADPHSAYNPSLSGDGRTVAYETSESKRGELDVWVADMRSGKATRVGRDIYEPALSPDGRYLAYTGGTDVFLRDLRTGVTRRVSDGREAWEPVVARDGAAVAYSSGDDVFVRDLRTGTTATVRNAFEPSLSADGRRVAFTTRGDQDTGVYVYDVATGATTLVSRASGAAGAPAQGASGHPSISADGRRVAFTSDAWNLSADKCNPARGIFVRDLTDDTTTLVSRDDGANRFAGPTKGSISGDEMRVMLLCA